MPYPYSSEECCDLTNYIYLLEPSWGKIIYWMVVHGTNVERWKRSALNFAVYSTALTVTALCALQEQMKLFHGIVSKVEKVKSVSFLSGKKILRSGLLLCGILEEGLFGSNFPVILFLVEGARKTGHQIVTSLFQNKHNQQEENIFKKMSLLSIVIFGSVVKHGLFLFWKSRFLVGTSPHQQSTMENFSKDKTICYYASCYDKKTDAQPGIDFKMQWMFGIWPQPPFFVVAILPVVFVVSSTPSFF